MIKPSNELQILQQPQQFQQQMRQQMNPQQQRMQQQLNLQQMQMGQQQQQHQSDQLLRDLLNWKFFNCLQQLWRKLILL